MEIWDFGFQIEKVDWIPKLDLKSRNLMPHSPIRNRVAAILQHSITPLTIVQNMQLDLSLAAPVVPSGAEQ
jgi:hypothetical protein